MKKNVFGNLCIILGILLLLSAAGLAGYNLWDDKRAGAASDEIMDELEKEIFANIEKRKENPDTSGQLNKNGETDATGNGEADSSAGDAGQTGIGTDGVADSNVAGAGEGSEGSDLASGGSNGSGSNSGTSGSGGGLVADSNGLAAGSSGYYLNGNYYIGVIQVPTLGISLPVMSNWSYANLKVAPCRYTGSCETNDLVIAGHNYSSHFSPLKWVKVGTQVLFTTVDGITYSYTVVDRETVEPADVAYMVREYGGDWDLTLFTCNTGGQTRCAVRCQRD